MTTFAIATDNNITAFTAAEQVPEGQDRFATEKEFAKLSADWPLTRFPEVWNAFAGVVPFDSLKPVKKFTDRKTAVTRIWKAIQALTPAPAPQAAPVAPKKAKATKRRHRQGRDAHGARRQQEGHRPGTDAPHGRRQPQGDHGGDRLAGALCRRPDYADLCWQPGLWGGDRCDGVGIIREPPGRRAVCRSVGNGRVLSLSELSCPERVP